MDLWNLVPVQISSMAHSASVASYTLDCCGRLCHDLLRCKWLRLLCMDIHERIEETLRPATERCAAVSHARQLEDVFS